MEIRIHDKLFRPLISSDVIAARIGEMGRAITADYQGTAPLFLSILNGSFVFTADLLRRIDNASASVSFVRLQSYTGDATSGTVSTLLGFQQSLQGRHVIVLEDIIDTGTTLHQFLPVVRQQNPASLRIASFLVKPAALQHVDVAADYFGFEIADKFVVGYGLDYEGLGRNLPGLYQAVG